MDINKLIYIENGDLYIHEDIVLNKISEFETESILFHFFEKEVNKINHFEDSFELPDIGDYVFHQYHDVLDKYTIGNLLIEIRFVREFIDDDAHEISFENKVFFDVYDLNSYTEQPLYTYFIQKFTEYEDKKYDETRYELIKNNVMKPNMSWKNFYRVREE